MTSKQIFRNPRTTIFMALVIVAVFASLGGYFLYEYSKEQISQEKYNDLKGIAILKAKEFERWQRERLADATVLINNPFFINHLNQITEKNDPRVLQQLLTFFQTIQKAYDYEGICLIDSNGSHIISTNYRDHTASLASQHFSGKLINDTNITFQGFALQNDSIPIIYLTVPITVNGKFRAGIIFHIDPYKYLYPLIQYWPTPSRTAETLIFTVQNDSVVFINPLRHLNDAPFQVKIPLTEKKVAAVQAVDGILGFTEAIDYRGQEIIAYLTDIPGTNWMMVSKVDKDEIYASMRKQTIIIVILVFSFMVFVSIIAYLIFRNQLSRYFVDQASKQLGLQTTEDILERKKAEEQINKVNRLYSTLMTLNSIIVRSKTVEGLSEDICRQLVQKSGYKMVWIGIRDPETRTVTHVASDGPFNHDVSTIQINPELKENEFIPAAISVNTGQNYICQHIQESQARDSWKETAQRNGYASNAVFPIIISQQVWGILSIYSGETGQFDQQEVALLDQLSQDISYAIQHFFTEEKQQLTEEKLADSSKRYELVFDSMNDGMALHQILYDESGVAVDYLLLGINPQFEKILHLSKKDVVNQKGSELFGVTPAPYLDIYARVADTLEPETFESFFAPMDKYFRISVFSHKKGSFNTIFQDITELVRARKEMERLNKELEIRVGKRTRQLQATNEDLRSFTYSVSHDLKAPLRSISGFGQILKTRYGNLLDEKGMHYLDNVLESAHNMHKLIEDLLRYSRIDRLESTLETINIEEIFTEIVGQLQGLIEETHSVIHTRFDEKLVLGNRLLLQQILINFLTNAIKYQPAEQHPEIQISSVAKGTQVLICVTDNGIGIEKAFRNKIFTIFERLHTEDEFPGTGIGLAIVKKASEVMEGSVWLDESNPGKGSRFCLSLKKPEIS